MARVALVLPGPGAEGFGLIRFLAIRFARALVTIVLVVTFAFVVLRLSDAAQ